MSMYGLPIPCFQRHSRMTKSLIPPEFRGLVTGPRQIAIPLWADWGQFLSASLSRLVRFGFHSEAFSESDLRFIRQQLILANRNSPFNLRALKLFLVGHFPTLDSPHLVG